MKEALLYALAEAEFEALEAPDFLAANDEIFDADDLPDHLEMQEVAEHY